MLPREFSASLLQDPSLRASRFRFVITKSLAMKNLHSFRDRKADASLLFSI
jgi:hypothetical protein